MILKFNSLANIKSVPNNYMFSSLLLKIKFCIPAIWVQLLSENIEGLLQSSGSTVLLQFMISMDYA